MRAALTMLLLLLACGSAGAQATQGLPFDGVEVFSHVLHDYGKLRPATPAGANPQDTVVIAFGATRRDTLTQLYAAGANLLIACDTPGRLGMWVADAKINTGWGTVVRPVTSASDGGYRGHAACPLLRREALPTSHPLFIGLQQDLATNNPRSLLRIDPGSGLHVLARLAQGREDWLEQFDEGWRPWVRGAAGFFGPIHIAGSPADAPPERRVVVLGGYGIFTNCMLVQPDCDNFAFACNCVRWLKAGRGGRQRTHAVFMVDDKVVDDFTPSLQAPAPMPSAALLDQLLADLEDEGFFRNFLRGQPRVNMLLIQGILIGATTALLAYAAKKLLAARDHPDPSLQQPRREHHAG